MGLGSLFAPRLAMPGGITGAAGLGYPPPQMQDGTQQGGLSGFLDRFTMPQNAVGQLGRALVMAGGTPLGTAYQMMDQQRIAMMQAGIEARLKMAQTAHSEAETANLQQGPDEITRMMVRAHIDPNSPQGQQLYAQHVQNWADPVIPQVIHDMDPVSQTVTDRIVGVPTSAIRNSLAPGGGVQAQPGQPPQLPGALGVPANPAPSIQSSPTSNSYRDPAYASIEAPLEQKYGLPSGLLATIRTKGEASNADQVSPAGAQSVYQITPGTRQLFLNRYGVDAYAGPQQAAEVAALHLRDSMARGEDPVRGYIGGPDQSKWGRQTQAYGSRVDSSLQQQAQQAIAAGADPAKVMARLSQMGAR